jgi:hypothetical protein
MHADSREELNSAQAGNNGTGLAVTSRFGGWGGQVAKLEQDAGLGIERQVEYRLIR